MTEAKIVAITGASNGMGYEAARLFARRGWRVYAGARRVEKIPTDKGVTALKLDVTDEASVTDFIAAILAREGAIHVLINNAGYGEYGPTEEIPMAAARQQFETNYFGAVALAQLVLPAMRAQGSGRIVNISSTGGNVYTPLGAHYYASKAALQQWSDALDLEVAPFGVRSVIVQPGGTASSWSDIANANARKNMKTGSPYEPLVDGVFKMMGGSGSTAERISNGATSAALAEDFYEAATDLRPKLRYFHALSDRLMVRVAKVHPRLWRAILRRLMRRFA